MVEKTFRYILSGGMGFLINMTVFYTLTTHLKMWYVAASVISFLVSTFAGFLMHKHVTYSDTGKTSRRKVGRYYVLNIGNVLLNAALIFSFVEYAHIPELISLILSNALISVYSYFIYQKYIFK